MFTFQSVSANFGHFVCFEGPIQRYVLLDGPSVTEFFLLMAVLMDLLEIPINAKIQCKMNVHSFKKTLTHIKMVKEVCRKQKHLHSS